MHVLVLPSEEFVPKHSPLAGIFQKQMMDAVTPHSNLRYGFLSVRLRFSPLMVCRNLLFRILGRRAGNELDDYTPKELLSLLVRGLFYPEKQAQKLVRNGYEGIVVEVPYLPFPTERFDWIAWSKGGETAFRLYCAEIGIPDLIHAHNALYGGLLAEKIKAEHGIPYVVTEHSSYFSQGLVPEHLVRRAAECYLNANLTAAVSESLRNSLVTNVGTVCRKMRIISNVVHPRFEEIRQIEKQMVALDSQEKAHIKLLSVGNLLPVKGHKFLLAALPLLDSIVPEFSFSLSIGGDGELRKQLELQAQSLNCRTHVTFLGNLNQDQVIREILGCDLLILPSITETFGVIIIEALALGRPVVATRCGGPDSIIDPSSGLLVDPQSSDAIARGIAEIASNLNLYEPDTIRTECLEKFGSRVFTQRVLEFYDAATDMNEPA